MSTQRKAEFDDDLTENAVAEYLSEHSDFFERHATLLNSLRLPHVTGGTVSLVERQVSALRQKDVKLERKLKDLLVVARANDALSDKIHRLTLRMLAASDLVGTISVVEDALRADFDADQSVLVLFSDPQLGKDQRTGRFLKVAPRDLEAMRAFDTFLAGSGPRCGQVRDAQRDFLFGEKTDEIGSAALVPLGEDAEIGFIAIGSTDAKRFHPGMSIDFLSRIGELVAQALKRF